MNNKKIQTLLADAMRSLPGDFALREVRFHIYQAIQKLAKVEESEQAKQRNAEKKSLAQTWDQMIRNGVQNPYTSGRTVDIINQMIAQENAKLQGILKNKERKQNTEEETLFD